MPNVDVLCLVFLIKQSGKWALTTKQEENMNKIQKVISESKLNCYLLHSWALVSQATAVSLDSSATVDVNFAFFYGVGEEPVYLVARYGFVEIVKTPKNFNYAFWVVKSN